MTDSTRTAAAWIERRMMLDLLLPADTTPTDAIAVVGRALSDASVEIAERDEIIGRRDDDLTAARATNGVMEASLREAIADLNATREERDAAISQGQLAAAEAATLRDRVRELESNAEQLRCDLKSARAEHESVMARIATVRAEAKAATDGRDAFCEAAMAALGSDDSTADVLASIETLKSERSRLKAEVAELRARPVLTVERLAAAISSKRTGEEGPRIGTPATIYAQLTEGGAVTLPAQDAATALVAKMHSYGWWCSSDSGDGRCEADMTRALASLGAPATTPSKPADVFAGVDHADLACTAAAAHKACTDGGPWMAAISAVLDALRVKLVAPVDPEEVARGFYGQRLVGSPTWEDLGVTGRTSRVQAMRATLTARGIPVTPEAGK